MGQEIDHATPKYWRVGLEDDLAINLHIMSWGDMISIVLYVFLFIERKYKFVANHIKVRIPLQILYWITLIVSEFAPSGLCP